MGGNVKSIPIRPGEQVPIDGEVSESRGESAIVLMGEQQVLAIFGLADQIRHSIGYCLNACERASAPPKGGRRSLNERFDSGCVN